MRRDATTQTVDQILVHVLEVIRDMEAHHALPSELLSKLLLKPVEVPLLHHEDQVRPAEVPSRDADPRSLFRAGGTYLVAARAVEDRLGSQAAQAILTADEENLHER